MKNYFMLLLLAFLLTCSKDKTLSGTITETDTGCAIEGLIVYKDSSYVAGAKVILHDQRLISRVTLGKKLSTEALVRSGNTTTNINGFFRIDSVDTGKYLVEINDHDSLGAVLATQINRGDTLKEVNGTLRHLGNILGRIDTTKLNGSTGKIYLPEIGRTVIVDSMGYFTITNIPVWNYYIRLAVGNSILTLPSDTIRIEVKENDTTKVLSLGAKTGTVIINGNVIENPNHP